MSTTSNAMSDLQLNDLEAQAARARDQKVSTMSLAPSTVAALIARVRAAEVRVDALLPRPLPGFEDLGGGR